MKLDEMKIYLAAHGVPEDSLYFNGGLGGGDIDGLERIDEVWHTYFSERGSKRNYKEWPNEDTAVDFVKERIIKLAKQYKIWKD